MMDLACFENVPVMPHAGMEGHIPQGGPIWPEFEAQHGPRFCYRNNPVDRAPPLREPSQRLRRPAIWGGYMSHEFGHLVAEHLTRLLPASLARPSDLVLFTLPHKHTPDMLPAYVWDVLRWLAVRPRAVRFILSPVLAPELCVAPQGEMLGNVAPDPAYLDLLDTLPERHGLSSEPRLPLVYVSRAGWAAKGRGAHLGESYLVSLLQRLGVKVIDPGQMNIRDQMQTYAQAEVLVFAEGSALHGRQLLGRLDQDIHVLMRRPGACLAQSTLAPRCRRLVYHDVTSEMLSVSSKSGTRSPKQRELRHLTASFYNEDALLGSFDRLGVKLKSRWKSSDYREAALSDALAWLSAQNAPATQTLPNLVRIIEQISPLDEPTPMTVLPAASQALH